LWDEVDAPFRGRKTITESEFSTHLVFEPRWFVPYVDS
jgi:hypothetical protein